jgi:hypothetical protein
MTEPARAMSKDDAFAELEQLQSDGLILLEGAASAEQVSLDGWNPATGEQENGNVGGVVVRFLSSGSRLSGSPSGGVAPDRLDPRNALALIRFCQWLNGTFGVTELYHLGISGGGVDANGNLRIDCHGQGRAVDFVGVAGVSLDDGSAFTLTVLDDWGSVSTSLTPDGNWPPGTGSAVSYRLDDPDADPFARDFFQQAYDFITSEWQDRTDQPDEADGPTSIGERSFIMHPDHPATAPGTPHGREAHRNHVHMQIGVTGTES